MSAQGETKEQAIVRSLAVFGATLQVLWLAAESGLRAVVVDAPRSTASTLLVIALVVWVLQWPSLFGPWTSSRRTFALQIASVVTVFAAGIVLVADPLAVGENGWFVGASVVNLASILGGIYLPRRMGVAVVVVIVVVETVVVVAAYSGGIDALPLRLDLIYPLYALALGLAGAASRYALVMAARGEDRSTRDLHRQQQARVTTESTDEAVTAAETRLHETVLNTLTAIVRGGLDEGDATRARLRERANESADVLELIATGADLSREWVGDLGADLASPVTDLRLRGVSVELEGDLAPSASAGPAYRAMGSAVRETLLNAIRHSDATTLRIRGDLLVREGGSTWRVLVSDDGTGFDSEKLGFGLRTVVMDGLAGVGGHARIASGNGAGTQILMEVPMPHAIAETKVGVGPLRAIGGPMLVAFSAFSLFVVGATWEFARQPWANLVSVALFASMAAALGAAIVSGRYLRMPWWLVTIVLIGVPVMTGVETLADAVPNPTGDWTSEAGAALMFIIVATGPWWAGPAALAAWLIAQDDFPLELTRPGTIVIVVAAVLGASLRRADRRTGQLRAETEDERAAIAVSQQRLSEARRRYADVDFAGLIALLRDIGSGAVDPRSAGVREACTRQERLIRSVLALHPERNLLHRDLVHLAVVALERGIDLSINAGEDLPVDSGLRGHEDATALLVAARPGSAARASTSRSGDECIFRLVVTVDAASRSALPAASEVLDEEHGLVAYEEICASGADTSGSVHERVARS